MARFADAVFPAEVLVPEEPRLTLAHRVHGSVTRLNEPLVIGARVAPQTVGDVVPELREQTRSAGRALRLEGARAVRAQARSRRAPVTHQLLSGDRIRAPVRVSVCRQTGSTENRQNQRCEEKLEKRKRREEEHALYM